MTPRKLLNWKAAFIYVHRWMGMAFGLVFFVWFVSGIAMMYVRMPVLSATERLGHVAPLDLSTARIPPAQAAAMNGLDANEMSIEMYYDGRPIYRFGRAKVYADTGTLVPGASAQVAVALIRRWVPPQFAASVHYDAYLLDSDQWTLSTEQRSSVPLHRIAVGDPAGTVYYVSEPTGEPTMKTDRRGRFLGYVSAVLHWTYFTSFRRQSELWRFVIAWGALAGAAMCVLGIVVGVVRLRMKKYRMRSGPSHSPYVAWMRWHHYTGLVFGLLAITWAFSGAMSLDRPFPSIRNQPATPAQRMAVRGTPLDLDLLTLPRLRTALDVLSHSFTPKILEARQFRGEPYIIARRPPAAWSYDSEIGAQEERYEPRQPHLIVGVLTPERGALMKFADDRMWDVAKAAMPGVPIEDAAWLNDYDAYYYDKNRDRPLPVLRVKYADEARTWLYLDPSLGTMARHDRGGRWNRWLYHGLHSLDFPFLRYRRPLWDVVVIVLSIAGAVLSITTFVPAWRRLARHGRRARRVYSAQRTGFSRY